MGCASACTNRAPATQRGYGRRGGVAPTWLGARGSRLAALRVHFTRNVLVHAPAGQRRVVQAPVATFFGQTTQRAARDQWCSVADQSRERFPRIAKLMDEAEDDVLA